MSNIVPIKYPLDQTGTSINNRVVGEPHVLGVRTNRAFVPSHGPFYARSGLVVRDAANGRVLTSGVHYKPVQMDPATTKLTAKMTCSVIVITDPTVSSNVEVDYQVVGGPQSSSVGAIQAMIDSLNLDERPVRWGEILGKPQLFEPAPHLHDAGDLYGFEFVVASLYAIEEAILVGDAAAHLELIEMFKRMVAEVQSDVDDLRADYDQHAANYNNPHQTTKAQVGLGSVENFGIATQAEAEAGQSAVKYMTPQRVAQAIVKLAGEQLNAHISDTNNPHQTTKAHVGLGNVQNFGLASTAEAQAGTSNAKYMTPALVKSAIDALVIPQLNAHINNLNNPHQVSKGQVGLGLVENYAVATTAEAQAGTVTNKYMTPALVKAAITTNIADLVAHVNNMNNPHQTTKAQIGLGSVEDYKQVRNPGGNQVYLRWNNSELQLTIDATYMGRVHTTSQPDPSIAAHVNNMNNPHQTNKTHVGLGNVQNYPMASTAEAQSGQASDRYMSPLLVNQAIQAIAIGPLQNQINNRVVIGSDGSLNSLRIGSTGQVYQDGDGSISWYVNGRYFTMNAGGNFTVHNGRVIAAGGFQPSDRRFKKNIRLLSARPLWRGFNFKSWTNRDTGEFERGTIAQELAKLAPDRVTTFTLADNQTERMAVDYTGSAFEMAYAAGVEIDAQQKVIAKQGKLIAKQQRLLDALEQRLAKLEAAS